MAANRRRQTLVELRRSVPPAGLWISYSASMTNISYPLFKGKADVHYSFLFLFFLFFITSKDIKKHFLSSISRTDSSSWIL